MVCDGREILRSAQNDIGVLKITMAWVRPHEVMDMGGVSRSAGKAGLKSLFQKSPLKSRAVRGATICDVILPNNT